MHTFLASSEQCFETKRPLIECHIIGAVKLTVLPLMHHFRFGNSRKTN
jgi:hypothetical protein